MRHNAAFLTLDKLFTMEAEQQRIALAAFIGWTNIRNCSCGKIPRGEFNGKSSHIPEITLDELHEAEKLLRDWPKYVSNVMIELHWKHYETLSDVAIIMSARKDVRAKALLKTIGKWEESK